MEHDQWVECSTGYLHDHRGITDTEVTFSKSRESCFPRVLLKHLAKHPIKGPQPLPAANM